MNIIGIDLGLWIGSASFSDCLDSYEILCKQEVMSHDIDTAIWAWRMNVCYIQDKYPDNLNVE